MTVCQHCTRKTTQPLCTPCTNQLRDLLAELPWLLHELNTTICRQDHLHNGGTHTTANPNPLNVGAMEAMREIGATLHTIAIDIAEIHGSERIPALINATPSQIACWLRHNLPAIQNHHHAGDHYNRIKAIVGDTQPGQIHAIINRTDLHFAGPCPTIRAHNQHGEDIRCNHTLWAADGETYVTCPRCNSAIDVKQNQLRAATLRDLLPADIILDILGGLGEPIKKQTLYTWINNRKLPPQGFWTTHGPKKRRTRPSDPIVYSLTRARQLRARTPQPAPA